MEICTTSPDCSLNVVNIILNVLFDSSSLGLSGEALEFLVINEGCCPVTVYESREAVERMDRGDGGSCGHLQALKGAAREAFVI